MSKRQINRHFWFALIIFTFLFIFTWNESQWFGGDISCALHIINPIIYDLIFYLIFILGIRETFIIIKKAGWLMRILLLIGVLINIPFVVFSFLLMSGGGCIHMSLV